KLRPLLLDFGFRTVRTPRFSGVQVDYVEPGGPAERAGLGVGDILVEADGRTVSTRDEFYLIFASKQVGDEVRLKVYRGGVFEDCVYTVEEAAAPESV